MQIIEIQEPNQNNSGQEKQIAVGIDFGTTNSLIAISHNREVKIIKGTDGRALIPSIIDFNSENFIIGSTAGLRSIKRLFGKTLKEILNTPALFSLIKNYSDTSSGELRLNFANKIMRISEVAAEIFIYLKEQAEKELATEITKAVITVPAHFNDAARGEVMFAARLAGFEVLRLIAEPTAAAYAYGLNKNQSGCYLVYDLGGGTFDVSILNMRNGIFQVIATSGDNMLGGDDIDQIVAQYFCDKFNLLDSSDTLKLAKEAKEALSYQDNFKADNISLDRQTFNRLILPLIDRTIDIAKDSLQDAENPSINGIILVGGATRIPLIKSKLQEIFNVNILSDIDPDKAVVQGASLQAENLTTPNMDSLLIDVVPLSVGMELYGGLVEKIIMRNTSLPISVLKEFTTYADNQTGIQFHILQGEREMATDCRSLARFELSNLPPMKAGNIRVEVTFAIDTDGILSVSTYEEISNKSHIIEVKPNYGIDEKEVTEILENAYKNAKSDYATRLLQETIVNAETLIFDIENAIKEMIGLLSGNEKAIIHSLLDNLKHAIIVKDRKLINNCIKDFKSKAKDSVISKFSITINALLKSENINQIK